LRLWAARVGNSQVTQVPAAFLFMTLEFLLIH
jgi:hypothetical protein